MSRWRANRIRPFVLWGALAYVVVAVAVPGGTVGVVIKVALFAAVLCVLVVWLVLLFRQRRTAR